LAVVFLAVVFLAVVSFAVVFLAVDFFLAGAADPLPRSARRRSATSSSMVEEWLFTGFPISSR
jgi:hypothetical protein